MLARSPNRKAAVAYLAACGATSITVAERDGVAIVTGKITGTVAARLVDRFAGCRARGQRGPLVRWAE